MFSVQRCHIFCVFPNIDVLQPSQDQNVISCQKASKSVSKWPRYLTKTAKNDVFRAAFPHFLRFPKYCCFRTIPGPKGNFVPKGVPVGFEMAEKNAYRQNYRITDRHQQLYILYRLRPIQYSGNRIYRSASGEHSHFDISGFQPKFDIQKSSKILVFIERNTL